MIMPSKIQLTKKILESTNHNSLNTEANTNNSNNYFSLIEINKLAKKNYLNIETMILILMAMIGNK